VDSAPGRLTPAPVAAAPLVPAGSLLRAGAAVTAAGLAAAMLVHFGLGAQGLIEAFTVAVLVWLSAIDLEQHLIPNRIVLPSAALVLVAQIAAFPEHALQWVACSFGAAAVMLVLALLSRGGLGMGDVKLALLIGAALGRLVMPAFLIGMIGSALVGAAMLVRRGRSARKQAIPLVPFLTFGTVVALLVGTPGLS
jgi:prepilin signal peptidase PulO-like enzyme (type II secretory pathway)